MRYSIQKETIKKIVLNTHTHPTADWIYNESKKFIPRISLGTVYRNLKHLESEGIIKRKAKKRNIAQEESIYIPYISKCKTRPKKVLSILRNLDKNIFKFKIKIV